MKTKTKVIISTVVLLLLALVSCIVYIVVKKKKDKDEKEDENQSAPATRTSPTTTSPTTTSPTTTSPTTTTTSPTTTSPTTTDDGFIQPLEKGLCEMVGPNPNSFMAQNKTNTGLNMECWRAFYDGYTTPEDLRAQHCPGKDGPDYHDDIMYVSVPCGKRVQLKDGGTDGDEFISGPYVGSIKLENKVDKLWLESSHTNWAFNNSYPKTIPSSADADAMKAALDAPKEPAGYCNKFINTQSCYDFCSRTDLSADNKISCKSSVSSFCSQAANRSKFVCKAKFPQ